MHINDFPTELLEEIFLLSISQPQEYSSSPPFTCCGSSPASTYVISKTCKRWKDIALNFAPLWTHLHVVDPRDVSIIQDLEVWMHRARTLPLCLSFRQYNSYNMMASAAVVMLFLNSLQRCQSFEMFVRTKLDSFYLQNIERIPSTCLESVNVWCVGQWGWDDAQLLSNLLLHTRSLRTIRWSCGLRCPRNTIPHPWENLRELSTSNVNFLAEFFNALSHCQNLERLKICGRISDQSYPLEAIVILPRLTHLSLQFYSGLGLTAILSPLVLPSLAELDLVLVFKLTRWTPILDMLQRSGVVLRRLGITGVHFQMRYRLFQAELIRILKMPYFRELKVLEVEEPLMAGCGIAKFLTLPTTAGGGESYETCGYLVHLERLCLVFQGTGAVKVSRFLQKLIESRLGTMSDPESARWHIEITEHIRFSLSIPRR